jgi:hypothetical protein
MGKTAILQAIILGIQGQSAFGRGFDMQQLIRDGEESAKIKLDLGDGGKTFVSTRLSITKSGAYLDIKTFDDKGNAVPVPGGPATFAKNLIGTLGFNPQEFQKKTAKEKLEVIYAICPELETGLAAADKEYATIQAKRATTKVEIDTLEARLLVTPETKGIPVEPVNPATIADRLMAAKEHNKKQEVLDNKIKQCDDNVFIAEKKESELKVGLERITRELKEVALAKIAHKESLAQAIEDRSIFLPLETSPIEKELADCNSVNELISKNKQREAISKELEQKKVVYSEQLKQMRAVEAKKIDVVSKAKIPVSGLTVGDGCLMYPHPETMVPTSIEQLSTGQFWPFVTELYCALNPNLKFIMIPNLHDLDAQNAQAMMQSAEEHGLQILAHETISEKTQIGLTIKVVDGEIA